MELNLFDLQSLTAETHEHQYPNAPERNFQVVEVTCKTRFYGDVRIKFFIDANTTLADVIGGFLNAANPITTTHE